MRAQFARTADGSGLASQRRTSVSFGEAGWCTNVRVTAAQLQDRFYEGHKKLLGSRFASSARSVHGVNDMQYGATCFDI